MKVSTKWWKCRFDIQKKIYFNAIKSQVWSLYVVHKIYQTVKYPSLFVSSVYTYKVYIYFKTKQHLRYFTICLPTLENLNSSRLRKRDDNKHHLHLGSCSRLSYYSYSILNHSACTRIPFNTHFLHTHFLYFHSIAFVHKVFKSTICV